VGFSGKTVPAVGTRSAYALAQLAVLYFIKMEGKILTKKTDEHRSDDY